MQIFASELHQFRYIGKDGSVKMIDSEYKFGAFVPVVPKIYQDAVSDETIESTITTKPTTSHQETSEHPACSIGPRWTPLKLISIQPYNHDTSIFEFELPDPQSFLHLPVTAHLLVKAPELARDGGTTETATETKTKTHTEMTATEHVRPYTAVEECRRGRFKIMVKRYPEWGTPEAKLKTQYSVFLYATTDHSYKPPGKVSNYIHSLQIGQALQFKFTHICHGKIKYPFDEDITAITMIAVGAGVAPMIRILRALLDGQRHRNQDQDQDCPHVQTIRLLYGARTVPDILQKDLLDHWHDRHKDDRRFQVCYCIGSRWNNVHFAAKTEQKQGPPLPVGWDTIPPDRKELGWADGDKIAKHGASDANDSGHRVFICGLPGVYISLAGSRFDDRVVQGTQLHRLGYRDYQVVKF